MGYQKDEVKKVLMDTGNYTQIYKMKVTGVNAETKWMDITESQLRRIMNIMR